MAEAGRARHIVDFVWGVNSRGHSPSRRWAGRRYRTVSVGRVQGPTLGFVTRPGTGDPGFRAQPLLELGRGLRRERATSHGDLPKGRLDSRAEAEKVRSECAGGTGVVDRVKRNSSQIPAPPPFNIGDLQKEAYRVFGYPPSRTLQIAERLYLRALISYPRTSSQRLPASIGVRENPSGSGSVSAYSKLVAAIMMGKLIPAEGRMDDPAHPAIHPTGERPKSLDSSEARVYDLVVKRFLAAFAPPARRERR